MKNDGHKNMVTFGDCMMMLGIMERNENGSNE